VWIESGRVRGGGGAADGASQYTGHFYLHHYLLQAPFDVGGKAEGVEAEAMMVATGKEGYVLEVY
jgi:hypothetical protein